MNVKSSYEGRHPWVHQQPRPRNHINTHHFVINVAIGVRKVLSAPTWNVNPSSWSSSCMPNDIWPEVKDQSGFLVVFNAVINASRPSYPLLKKNLLCFIILILYFFSPWQSPCLYVNSQLEAQLLFLAGKPIRVIMCFEIPFFVTGLEFPDLRG